LYEDQHEVSASAHAEFTARRRADPEPRRFGEPDDLFARLALIAEHEHVAVDGLVGASRCAATL
jgi:hypothetical protein